VASEPKLEFEHSSHQRSLSTSRAARRRILIAIELRGTLSAEIDGLRRALGSDDVGRIAPHITLVAPTNVSSARFEDVLARFRGVVERARPFTVDIGPAGTFSPTSTVVYLTVVDPQDVVGTLRASLVSHVLPPPSGREERPFVPHVSLHRRLGLDGVTSAIATLAHFSGRFTVDQVHVLEQLDHERRPWVTVSSATLGGDQVVGRGGFEVTFSLRESLEEEAAAMLERNWASYSVHAYGETWAADEPYAVVARSSHSNHSGHSGPSVVAVATGSLQGRTCVLDRIIVDPAERNIGIGAQLLRYVEKMAFDRSCESVRLLVRADSSALGFYLRHGYRQTEVLRAWREQRDFAVVRRSLTRPDGPGRTRIEHEAGPTSARPAQ